MRPQPLFLSAELWVIRYHLGSEQSLLCGVFFWGGGHSQPLGGGGGHVSGSGTGTVLLRSLGGVLVIKYLYVFNFASYINKISLSWLLDIKNTKIQFFLSNLNKRLKIDFYGAENG